MKALEHLLEISAHMRAYAAVVDCLNPEIQVFYEQYGFEVLQQQEGRTRMFLPMKTIKALFEA